MFAPPPVPSLSKAEIQARRAQAQEARHHVADSPNTSPALARHASPASSSSEHSRTIAPAIIRKIGRIGGIKHEKQDSVVISNPLPSLPPSARLPPPPAIPMRYPPPLPPGSKSKIPGRQNVSPGERVHLPLGPPRRPPRPSEALSSGDQPDSAVLRSPSSNSNGSKRSAGSTSSTSYHSSASVQELEASEFGEVLKALKNIGSNAVNGGKAETDITLPRSSHTASTKKEGLAANNAAVQLDNNGHEKIQKLRQASGESNRGKSKTAKKTSIAIPTSKLTDKALPDTPKSIVMTPVNFYASGAARSSRDHAEKQIQTYKGLQLKRSSKLTEKEVRSGTTTPMQIRLRTGSLVIVKTPEMDAWRRCCYIQGPIRLNKPAVMPRKNSLASLEAFQDAIDQVYDDNASLASRKRGDDAAIEDICRYFLTFGFDNIQYDGDILAVEGGAISEESEDEADQPNMVDFETPPDSPSFYKTMLEMPNIDLPPIENEETLRARGIARLAKLRQQATSTTSSTSMQRVTSSRNQKNSIQTLPTAEAGSDLASNTFLSNQTVAKIIQHPEATAPSSEIEMPSVPWVSSFRSQHLLKAAKPKRFST